MFKKHTKAISIILTIAMIATMFCTALSVSAEGSYVVAGDVPTFPAAWEPTAEAGAVMTDEDGDGVFEYVAKDVPAGTYSFKFTDGTGWGVDGENNWADPATGQNYQITLTSQGDITFKFDSATKVGEAVSDAAGEFELQYISVVGNGDETSTWCNGVNWDPAAEVNRMTEVEPGVWSITFKGVEAFDGYEVKFAVNGAWAYNWTVDGVFDGQTNTPVEVTEKSDVTLTIDVNGFDFASKSGDVVTNIEMVPAAVEDTTAAPEETTVAPEETTVAPEETTVAPEETTVAPEETTVAPEETTAAPEETTAAPEETTAAPSGKTTVNGKDVKVGDKVNYTMLLTIPEKIENIQGVITYDSSKLKLVESSDAENDDVTAFPVLAEKNLVWNTNLENAVKFNGSFLKGFDFTAGGVLVSLNFEVIAEGESEVKCSLEEMNSVDATTCYVADGEVKAEFTQNDTVTVVSEPITEPTTAATEPTTEPTTAATEPTTEPTTAASEDAVINGVKAHVGDTISYTATLQAAEKLVNFQATTKFDSSILELVKPLDTEVAFPVDPDVVYNEDLDGMVKFNDSKLKGIDFTTEGVLVTLNFKVIAGGETSVWTEIEEMNSVNDTVYAADGVMVTEYSFNESVAVVDCPHTTEPEVPTEPATDAPATPDEPTTVAPTTTPNTPGSDNGPSNGAVQTGDAATAVVLLSILVAAAGVMFLVRRRVQG